MADKFDIMKLLVPLNLDFVYNEAKSMVTHSPTNDETTETVWKEATELSKEGWELVGIIPITESRVVSTIDRISKTPRDIVTVYTSGYELFFKRRIENTN
jgi:hypothetical protein